MALLDSVTLDVEFVVPQWDRGSGDSCRRDGVAVGRREPLCQVVQIWLQMQWAASLWAVAISGVTPVAVAWSGSP